MKKSIVLTILMITIFSSHIWSTEPIAPTSRFGGDHLINPTRIIASDGEIFVIEPVKYRILIFTDDGEFKMELGREGEGPSEFKMLSGVYIYGNVIYCYDPMGRNIHLFSKKDKQYIKYIPLSDTLFGHPPNQLVINQDGNIVMCNSGYTIEHTLIGLYTPEGKPIKRFYNAFPAYQSRNEFLEDSKCNGHANVDSFKNDGFIAVSEGNIYFANIIENHVVEMDMNGKVLNRFKFPLPSHEKTLRFIKISRGGFAGFYDFENQLTYDLRARDNSIYILCRDNGISYIFRLEKGAFHEVCRMKEQLTSFDIMNNKIYCLEAGADDEEKNPEVLVYNLPKN